MEIVALVVLAAIYFVPTIVAVSREHNNATPIFLVNLLLGWAFGVGWVIALVWACTKDVKQYDSDPQADRVASGQLVICGGCGKQISFLATACPGCGHPRTEEEITEAKMKEAVREEMERAESSQCPHCQGKMRNGALLCGHCDKWSCPKCRQPISGFTLSCKHCKQGCS